MRIYITGWQKGSCWVVVRRSVTSWRQHLRMLWYVWGWRNAGWRSASSFAQLGQRQCQSMNWWSLGKENGFIGEGGAVHKLCSAWHIQSQTLLSHPSGFVSEAQRQDLADNISLDDRVESHGTTWDLKKGSRGKTVSLREVLRNWKQATQPLSVLVTVILYRTQMCKVQWVRLKTPADQRVNLRPGLSWLCD